jgi:hypothetical protein
MESTVNETVFCLPLIRLLHHILIRTHTMCSLKATILMLIAISVIAVDTVNANRYPNSTHLSKRKCVHF